MPELAEVDYYRRRWDPGAGDRVLRVRLHSGVRDFRGTDPRAVRSHLTGSVLVSSEARGKQILFRLTDAAERPLWLGIHLGMSGRLWVREEAGPGMAGTAAGDGAAGATAGAGRALPARTQRATRHTARITGAHDHLVLVQARRSLVFSDPRQFGRIRFSSGPHPPQWWADLPPSILSGDFTPERVEAFLRRHARAPIKSVLLMQERFPGIGNWMADEILFRAGIHPRTPAGACAGECARRIRREARTVARTALRRIAQDQGDLPAGWLIHRRWSKGERCPRTGVLLVRETIGGRTSVYSPARQPPRRI